MYQKDRSEAQKLNKKSKFKNLSSESPTIDSNSYLFAKPVDIQALDNCNPLSILDPALHRKYVIDTLTDWTRRYPEPVIIRKGLLVDAKEFTMDKKVTKSGWNCLNSEGSSLHEFEWSSKIV
jgi:hypothetical protein